MGVTIRDVAREAGVSVATVSRVFNHEDKVSPKTADRVRSVADEMGYEPNPTAQSLSHGRTHAMGVVLPAPHGEFFSEVMRGIDDVAQASEFHLLISSSHYSLEEGEAALRALRGRVDGLLVMTTHVDAGTMLARRAPDVPVVLMNSVVDRLDCDVFYIENREGAHMATSHLVERGGERFAVILGPTESYDVRERREGFREALQAGGIDPDAAAEVQGDFTQDSGYAAGEAILEMDPLPDAVFSCNDYMAIGAMSALQKAGVQIPEDLAIAGFDDIPSARYASPPLTTVQVPVYDLGRAAAQRLVSHMRRGKRPAQTRTFPSELVVRASTAPKRA